MAEKAADRGWEGNLTQSKVEQKIDLMKWSSAWEKLQAREGLEKDAFEKATRGFRGFGLRRNHNVLFSMSKARKYGRTEYIDSRDALSECCDELEQEKIFVFFKIGFD